eukprot:CAMPEP_0117439590 /NCGR_PEP_ID=MMETSP0759-20121206/2643_1 /TAXON_ID=63605 /ORGANISM="Percolomonas cosmopolitus, Strain WS" /LENGTH=818 /DNA_ID=CAMNT_0005231309 /DNA_START=1707 /DNA_END=4163 /DNA_ORIENTATION=+
MQVPVVWDLGRVANVDIWRMQVELEIGWVLQHDSFGRLNSTEVTSSTSHKFHQFDNSHPVSMDSSGRIFSNSDPRKSHITHNDSASVGDSLEQHQRIHKLFQYMKQYSEQEVQLSMIEFPTVQAMRDYALKNGTDLIGGYLFEHVPLENHNEPQLLEYSSHTDDWVVRVLYFGMKQHLKLPILSQILIHSLQDLNQKRQPHEPSTGAYHVYYQEYPKSDVASILFVQVAPYFLTIGLTSLIPLFTQLISVEVEKELKLQLRLFGVRKTLFWFSRFVSDSALYLCIVLFQWICIGLMGQSPAFVRNHPIASLLLYAIYGLTIISFSYLISFLFKKEKDASKWCGLFVSLSVSFSYLIVTLFLNNDVPTSVQYLLSFVPTYSLYYGLTVLGQAVVDDEPITLLQMITFSKYGGHLSVVLLIMLVEAFFFSVSIILLELSFDKWRSPSTWFNNRSKFIAQWEDDHQLQSIDPTVQRESELALSNTADYPLRVLNVHKVYKTRKSKLFNHAVKNVSFKVERGEIFSLIGKNGAGKSTLIDMLTGKRESNQGTIFVNNHNLVQHADRAYKSMSVVAQDNRLWDTLTCYQHVKIFSMLRGITGRERVLRVLEEYNLTEHAHKKVKHLSGGNKRKLSVALAFLGEPQVVYLDEPSSAMDASSRRQLWIKLQRLKEGRVIVMTSHSMQEVEQVSDRIGILVDGELQCVDATEELKHRYEAGYQIAITMAHIKLVTRAQRVIEDFFGDHIHLVNKINDSLRYEVDANFLPLSSLFEKFETWKDSLKIDDYSISQATLEQLFSLDFTSLNEFGQFNGEADKGERDMPP